MKVSFALHRREMKEMNLRTLHANLDILTSGLDILCYLNLKDNLTDSTAKS